MDGSSYSKSHSEYHPIIRNYLERFGYYDIFLINNEGFIVYSVFKEVDFGTSLLSGPYQDTNFAKAFQLAANSRDSNFIHLEDFEPYSPSYDAPASFIASPIFDGNKKIGVLIFQMPIDKINSIMTNNHEWESVGLGESGETYLVGEDFLLRNQSRFLIEDPDSYFEAIKETGVSILTIAKIRNINSTIGLQRVKTEGTVAALGGETGTGIFPDYRNISVLSSYKPLNIPEVNWVIMSEIDEEEAFSTINALRNQVLFGIGGLIIFVYVLSNLVSKSITSPIKALRSSAAQLAKGDLENPIEVQSGDEIGELSQSFERMRVSMKKLVNKLEKINLGLENKIVERTIELEKSNLQAQLMFSASNLAVGSIDIERALSKVIKDVGKITNWPIGHVYRVKNGENGKELHTSEIWYLADPKKSEYFQKALSNLILAEGEGIPGKALLTGKIARKKNVKNEKRFNLLTSKQRQSVKSALAIPVSVSGNVEAILEFFPDIQKKPDKSLLKSLSSMADQISRVLERFALEEQIKSNEERLKFALEGSSDGLWDWKIKTNEIYYSPRWEMMLGYKPGEISPTIESWEKLVDPEHIEMANTKMADHLEGKSEVYEAEYRARAKSGKWVWILARGKIAAYDENNEPTRFVGTHVDITQQKMLEAKLQQVNDRMEDELTIARDIQMGMLPSKFPAFPNRNDILVHAALDSAREVGGDFYYFFFIDEEHFCFVIGDVSGKGAPGALFMAVAKTLIKSRAMDDLSTASIVTHVNNEMSQNNPNSMFVTIFLGILNVKTGRLVYTNGGHNPPYLFRNDGTIFRFEKINGPIVGAIEDLVYSEDVIKLKVNDRIFTYTDGVTEAMDIKDNLYSEKKLLNLLKKVKAYSVEDINQAVVDDVQIHIGKAVQSDDITILAVKYSNQIEAGEVVSLNIEISNDFSEMEMVEEKVISFANANNFSDDLRRNIIVVMDEFLNNIISYAYQDDEQHFININFNLSGNRLVITLEDDGIPFNPFAKDSLEALNIPDNERMPGGLGIHFVKSIMDEYNYHRRIDNNVVTLIKVLDQ